MGLPVRRIRLRRGERRRLERLVNKRTTPQRVVERANIVLCSAEGRSGSAICRDQVIAGRKSVLREAWAAQLIPAYRGRRSRSGSTGTRQVALKSCSRTDHARVDPARSLGRRSGDRPQDPRGEARRRHALELPSHGQGSGRPSDHRGSGGLMDYSPHRIEYFKLSTDPHFVEKLRWTASAQSIIAKVSKAKETLATQH